MARRIRSFDEFNWWQWGRGYYQSEQPRVYVNNKTRRANGRSSPTIARITTARSGHFPAPSGRSTMVPHLTTALTGPLLELERQFLDNACDIEKLVPHQWQEHMPPFYGSTDLRNSGFKLAPVDLNLFPGGFNNLNDAFMPLCVQAAQAAIERICPDASKLLLIPRTTPATSSTCRTSPSWCPSCASPARRAHRQPAARDRRAHRARARQRRHADARAAAPQRQPPRPGQLRPLRGAAQQRPVGRASRRC
jgi:hypothetical protein